MEQTSSYQILFNAALQDYQNQTGNSLIDHPFTKQLESCHSVDSITAILEEQAQIFRNFRGDNGKLVKSIKYSVNVLYTLSTNTASIGLVRQKPFIDFPCFQSSFYTTVPACECNIRWHRHPTCRMSLPRTPLHVTVTSKSHRRSKTLAPAMTHWSICLRPLRTSSAGSASIPGSLLRQP